MNHNDLAIAVDGGTLGSDPNIVATNDASQFTDTMVVRNNSVADSISMDTTGFSTASSIDTAAMSTTIPTISSTTDTASATVAHHEGNGTAIPIFGLLIAVILLVALTVATKPKKLNIQDNSTSANNNSATTNKINEGE